MSHRCAKNFSFSFIYLIVLFHYFLFRTFLCILNSPNHIDFSRGSHDYFSLRDTPTALRYLHSYNISNADRKEAKNSSTSFMKRGDNAVYTGIWIPGIKVLLSVFYHRFISLGNWEEVLSTIPGSRMLTRAMRKHVCSSWLEMWHFLCHKNMKYGKKKKRETRTKR